MTFVYRPLSCSWASRAGACTGRAPGGRARLVLGQSRIDDEIGTRAPTRLFGCQKQRNACNIARAQAELERLQIEELLIDLGRTPERFLPLGQDRTRHQRVDADALRSQLARQGPCQAVDRGLG